MDDRVTWFDKDGRELRGEEAKARLSLLKARYSSLLDEARSELLRLANGPLQPKRCESDMDSVLSLGEALSQTKAELEEMVLRIEWELKNY